MKYIKGIKSLMEYLEEVESRKISRGWSSLYEYPLMYSFAKLYDPDNIIEVGTCNGASALAFALGLKDSGKVYTWDLVAKEAIDKKTSIAPKIIRYVEDYAKAGAVISDIPGKRLFFIDGDHSQEGCYQDIKTSLPYFRIGDTMIFHDICSYKGVDRALNQAMEEQPWLSIVKRRVRINSKDGFEIWETYGL